VSHVLATRRHKLESHLRTALHHSLTTSLSPSRGSSHLRTSHHHPLASSLSPHVAFLRPTKYHTWQFFQQLLHRQYGAIQEGYHRYDGNKEGAKKGVRTTQKDVLCGEFGRCNREGSCHHRTIPPTKERAKQQHCSLFFLAQFEICKSHPMCQTKSTNTVSVIY
jgi:hypothetical protein